MHIPDNLDWHKSGGLLPAIIQHADSGEVLMLGYMNADALAATCAQGRVTFYSRSKQGRPATPARRAASTPLTAKARAAGASSPNWKP